jgi:PhnB protein
MPQSPIPEGMHAVTPYLIVPRAAALIAFLAEAFGAVETFRVGRPDGLIRHASLKLADSTIELADASEEYPALPCALHLYVADADATFRSALAAGATATQEPYDAFYGDREAGIIDPSGNHWFIATRQETLSEAEMAARVEAMLKQDRPGA